MRSAANKIDILAVFFGKKAHMDKERRSLESFAVELSDGLGKQLPLVLVERIRVVNLIKRHLE